MKAAPPIVILGAGGHARVLLATLRASGAHVVGCIAPAKPGAAWPADVPWLGSDDALHALDRATALANGIGSTGDGTRRRAAYESARAAGFRFAVVRHPSAMVETDVTIGQGSQALAGSILQVGVRVGENVIINTGVIIDHESEIGDHVHVAPGARLSGGVKVGAGAHVGTGATVIQGVSIGSGAVVGAGAVVLSDVPAYARVAGVPARPLGPPREVAG